MASSPAFPELIQIARPPLFSHRVGSTALGLPPSSDQGCLLLPSSEERQGLCSRGGGGEEEQWLCLALW